MTLSVGQQVGPYRLLALLGRGGMAEVWAARHTLLQVTVALKVLLDGSPVRHDRLLREGRAQAAMSHPNILPVRDVIDVRGQPGLVLPLVRGPSLAQLLSHHRLSTADAIALFRAVVVGVRHAHGHGLVHRDLKPANILLDEQHGRLVPQIADFGIVKEAGRYSATRTGMMMGTPGYVAPEQVLDASRADARADLFSLGVLLAELLGGRVPFVWDSLGTLLEAYRRGPDLAAVPPRWRPLCQALLAPAPEQRLSSCAALLERMAEVQPALPAGALICAGPLGDVVERLWRTIDAPALADDPADETVVSVAVVGQDAPAPPNNLPEAMDAFVGRDQELAALAHLLGGQRLVTVVGSAGVGKTRAALQVARRSLAAYPGGVFFCDLSEVRSRAGIVAVVAQVLEVPLRGGDPVQAVGRAIADRGEVLLVLDNLEQVSAHTPETLGVWSQCAPQARFLVTSRVLLELPGEQLFELPPMAAAAAVDLFAIRAQARAPAFAIDADNIATVTELVQRLDRLPLAIELAAVRIRLMSPRTMLQRMEGRSALQAPSAVPAGRHETLRAAIDWSWELLAQWEKAAFAQCSVFEGGFTLAAAESVLDLSAFEDAPWPMDAIQSLVDKSLVRLSGETALEDSRFEMLVSLHAYAAERLAEQDVAAIEGCQRRHAAFFAALGNERALEGLQRAGGVAQWWALAVEADNLSVAQHRAVRWGEVVEAVNIASAMFTVARRQQPARAAQALRASLAMPTIDAHPALKARLLRGLGIIHKLQGEIADAERCYLEVAALGRASGDARIQAIALGNLGNLYGKRGQFDKAVSTYRQALAMHRQAGSRSSAALVLGNLGAQLLQHGRVDEAEPYLLEALDLQRALGNRRVEGILVRSLGALYANRSEHSRAEAQYIQALAIHQEVGDRDSEANTHGSLALLYANRGQVPAAEHHYLRSLAIHKETGNRLVENIARGNLAYLLAFFGRLEEAEEHYTTALAAHREIGHRHFEGVALGGLGVLYAFQGRYQRSEERLQQSLAIHRALGDRRFQGVALQALGALRVEQGQLDTAAALYTRALAHAHAVGDRSSEATAHSALGEIRARQGSHAEADTLLAQSEALLEKVGSPLHAATLRCRQTIAAALAGNTARADELLEDARQRVYSLTQEPRSRISLRLAEATRQVRAARSR